MKKTIILALIISAIIGAGFWVFISKQISDVNNNDGTTTTIDDKDSDVATEEKEDTSFSRDYDKKINEYDGVLEDKNLDIQTKTAVNFAKAFAYLGKRDSESLKKSIDGFKSIIRDEKTPTAQKAKAYEKLANMYWRTGGNKEVANYVFSGEFKKFADIKENKINIYKSISNLYKKSYNTTPSGRAAIETAYYSLKSNDLKDARKWLKIAEDIEENKKGNLAGFYNKDYLVNYGLILRDKKFAPRAPINDIYKKAYKYSVPSGDTDYDCYNSQGLPFLEMFKIIYLYESDKDKNKDEIKNLLNDIVKFVKGDQKPKYNEYRYFLKIQSKKTDLDLVGKYLPIFAEYSEEFKKLLEEYNFNLK